MKRFLPVLILFVASVGNAATITCNLVNTNTKALMISPVAYALVGDLPKTTVAAIGQTSFTVAVKGKQVEVGATTGVKPFNYFETSASSRKKASVTASVGGVPANFKCAIVK